MRSFKRTSFAVCVWGLSGCVSTGSHAPGVGSATWSGSFRQPQTAASAVVGPATTPRGAAYGSLNLTPTGKKAGGYKVELPLLRVSIVVVTGIGYCIRDSLHPSPQVAISDATTASFEGLISRVRRLDEGPHQLGSSSGREASIPLTIARASPPICSPKLSTTSS